MSTHITVRPFGQIAPEHRASLASLPATLRLIETGTPDIALSAPDEPSIAEALSLSAKAVVIADPAAVDPAGLRRLEAAAPLIIPVLTLAASLRQVGADGMPAKAGLIHSRLGWQGDMKSAILEHLAGLATVVDALTDLKLLSRGAAGYVGSAKTTEGVDIAWSGSAKAIAARYELDAVGLADRLEVRAELDGSARPLLIRRNHAGGTNEPIASYETGLRRFWRDVASALGTGKPVMTWKDVTALHALADTMASALNEDAA